MAPGGTPAKYSNRRYCMNTTIRTVPCSVNRRAEAVLVASNSTRRPRRYRRRDSSRSSISGQPLGAAQVGCAQGGRVGTDQEQETAVVAENVRGSDPHPAAQIPTGLGSTVTPAGTTPTSSPGLSTESRAR